MHALLWQIDTASKDNKNNGSLRPVDGTAAKINVVQTYHPLHTYP
jgi:hypothetical protein